MSPIFIARAGRPGEMDPRDWDRGKDYRALRMELCGRKEGGCKRNAKNTWIDYPIGPTVRSRLRLLSYNGLTFNTNKTFRPWIAGGLTNTAAGALASSWSYRPWFGTVGEWIFHEQRRKCEITNLLPNPVSLKLFS